MLNIFPNNLVSCQGKSSSLFTHNDAKLQQKPMAVLSPTETGICATRQFVILSKSVSI